MHSVWFYSPAEWLLSNLSLRLFCLIGVAPVGLLCSHYLCPVRDVVAFQIHREFVLSPGISLPWDGESVRAAGPFTIHPYPIPCPCPCPYLYSYLYLYARLTLGVHRIICYPFVIVYILRELACLSYTKRRCHEFVCEESFFGRGLYDQ